MNQKMSRIAAAIAIALLGWSAYAEEARAVDVPAGELDAALETLARQSGARFMYSVEAVKGLKTHGVQGEFTAEQAIGTLLRGTELKLTRHESGAFLISRRDETAFAGAGERIRVAQAQTPAAEDSAAGVQLDEIIVTARKRSERVLEVPMSVSVFDARDLERKGIEGMGDLAYAAPGMMVQEFGPGRQVIFMRGVGNRVGSSALTGVYLDEVPVTAGSSSPANIGQLDLHTVDLERVEVLKGPQGTLYGAGAVSGTVRFITADPKLDVFSAKGEATASFTEHGDPSQAATATVNVPVADNFAVRIAASHENNGGWIDRPEAGRDDVNENKLTDVRVKTLWQPSEALAIKAMAVLNRNRDDDSGGINHSDLQGNYRLGVDPDRRAPFHDDYDLFNLAASYDFGFASLLSSSSYIDHGAEFLYSFSGGPQTQFDTYEALESHDQNVKVFSQEVRLTSEGDGPAEWTVGAYYQDVKERWGFVSEAAFGGVEFPASVGLNRNKNSAWAAFGDMTYSITDRWKVGTGVRYFEDDREVIGVAGRQVGVFDKTTWRATTSYAIRDNVRTYLNVASGFRSGGFSAFGFPPYQPETLVAYEGGVKMVLPTQGAQIDFALFRSDYKDYLRRGLLLNPNTNQLIGAESNIGDVKIEGAELSASVRLIDRLTLSFSGAYTDSMLTRLRATGSALGQPGDPIDYIPKFSYTAGLDYEFHWGANLPGFVRIDYNYRDKVSVIDRSITLPVMYSDDTALLNARVGMARDRWSVQLFGENLANENGSFDPWVYWSQAVRNRPRTYGLKVEFDFK